MVRTNSMPLELGFQLPDFQMMNVNSSNNEDFSSYNLDNRHLLLMFICAHCPFVKYIENQISILSKDIDTSFQTIAISSNDIITHPSDSPANLKKQAQLEGWTFPYLYDSNQNFAKSLKAACTPDFYLFSNKGDGNFLLYYHGQLDGSRPGNNIPISGEDLRFAINKLNQGHPYPSNQTASLGCNIKWKPGKEPSWFK